MRGDTASATLRRIKAGEMGMTRRTRIIGLVAVALVVAGLGVLLTRDWRSAIIGLSAQAERASGLGIAIDGKARLALLPLALTAEQVRLHRDGAPLVSAQRLSLHLSLPAFLTGRLQVSGIALDEVKLGPVDLDTIEARFADQRLDGFTKAGGHTVTFSGNIDAEQKAFFRLTVPTVGLALHFDGMLESDHGNPAFSGHLSLNSGNLAALLPALPLPSGLLVRAEADLEAGDGQISLVNLTLEGNGSRAAGSLVALSGSPALLEADLGIDALDLDAWHASKSTALSALLPPALTPPSEHKAAAERTAPQPAPAPPALSLPTDLFASVRLNIDAVSWHGQTVRDVQIQAGLEQGEVILRHAQANIRPNLRLNADGALAGAHFKGRLRLNGPGLSGRADLTAAWPQLELADIRLNHDGMFATGRLAAEWQDALLADWSGSIGTWRDTALKLRLRPGNAGFEASDISLRIDSLALHGQGSADFSAPRPRITAALRGDDLDLSTLPGSPIPPAVTPRKTLGKTSARPQRAPPPQKSAPTKSSPFSTAPLDWSGLEIADGALTVEAHSLRGGFGRLEQPALTVSLNNGTAKLESLRAGWLGGTLSASGGVSGGAVPSLRLDATLTGLDLAQAKPDLAGLSLEKGRLNAQLRLHSFGKSSRDMAANAQGEGQVDGGAGIIGGLDLPAINGQLARIENIGNVLALVQTGLGGGQTPYTRLSGRVTVKDGIARSPDFTLTATGGTLAADSAVNLTEWSTQTSVSLALAALPSTPIVVHLSGPMGSPRKVVDVNALQKALVQSGLGRALGKVEGGSEEKANGGKILKDLFRAFGGKN
ncbi:AsmA family protein [Magnetospirillum sulfuroxidans]|uniref:AsmA family protein n=1 Tax=Magnetospirillum sulfuroxidans TaxID=611300 RepID=A0ABS5IDF7_9PROT|nr:AsmA-like C-terminal region-containing protein [Magnetospirillum sulfuroxidans]MBR9972456.1 AsmA family protein [Magnetospirillum sulfuroxidans]